MIHPTQGWLTITNSTPGHSGNYSCVPSYTTPDWVSVHVIRGQNQEGGTRFKVTARKLSLNIYASLRATLYLNRL